MAEGASAAIQGAQLAKDVLQWIISSFGTTPEMSRPDALKGVHIKPLQDWKQMKAGTYKFSYGSISITGPKKGIGLTTDPHSSASFQISNINGQYSSIKLNGKYVFAGDQATVKTGKDKVKEWEQFEVKSTVINGCELCTIKCKRDGEYWYIDEEGMVRHRLRKEDGFKFHVFYAQAA